MLVRVWGPVGGLLVGSLGETNTHKDFEKRRSVSPPICSSLQPYALEFSREFA